MSVQQMGRVWELDLPHSEAWVLMAYADHADHEGGSVRPSIGMITWKTGYSERQVHRIVASLIKKGMMVPAKSRQGGRGKAILYRLELEKGAKKSPFSNKGDTMTPFSEKRVPSATQKGAISDIKGAIAMAPEPSLEPSFNQKLKNIIDGRARETSEEAKTSDPYEGDPDAEWKRAYDERYGRGGTAYRRPSELEQGPDVLHVPQMPGQHRLHNTASATVQVSGGAGVLLRPPLDRTRAGHESAHANLGGTSIDAEQAHAGRAEVPQGVPPTGSSAVRRPSRPRRAEKESMDREIEDADRIAAAQQRKAEQLAAARAAGELT
jgi:hypothetical protein